MRILIGFDGSESGEAIFDDLKRAGLPRDAEVTVLTIADLLTSAPPAKEVAAQVLASPKAAAALEKAESHAERIVKEAKKIAAGGAARLRTEFPGWNVESKVVTGTPEWELLDAAQGWNADLIVVGSKGRTALGRLFWGSVSKRAATDARCSVRVVRRVKRKKPDAPPKIIIGIDGSTAAGEAVREVGRRIWPSGTQIRLMVVQDQPSTAVISARLPYAAGMIFEAAGDVRNRAETMLRWASGELKAIGLDVSISIQKGDPKRMILKEAEKWNADSVFVGTRDFKNAFERFRLGSVSTAVTAETLCTAEIVRPRDLYTD